MPEKASDKQVAYIRSLGGKPPRNLTKRAASQMISERLASKPASDAQLRKISVLEEEPDPNLSARDASALIDKLEKERNADRAHPPTKAQLKKIEKLGGAPNSISTRGEAEDFIDSAESAEDDMEFRAYDAISTHFEGLGDSREMPMKKPSAKLMREAIAYGDSQGWPERWEIRDNYVAAAIYAVAPDKLKNKHDPPREPGKAKGCLTLALACIVTIAVLGLLLYT